MLADWVIDILRCPGTGQCLEECDGVLARTDGRTFPFKDGIASLVYPDLLEGDDAKWNHLYDIIAPFYDYSERVLGPLLAGASVMGSRAEIVSLAGLEPGSRLLEVSPGPGVFHPLLRQSLGDTSQIVSADLSLKALRECRRRHRGLAIELLQANIERLPFADGSFDAVFHFGGVSLLALSEFTRVVRKGGRIVWGEQVSERFSRPEGRRLRAHTNPEPRHNPPITPAGTEVAARYDVFGGLGYLTVARRRA